MYSIDIPPGAVLDRFENSNTWEMITFYTVPEADYPEVTSTWPKSGEGSVSVLPRIQLNFKGEAALSAGRISVSDENGNSVEFALDAFADGSKSVYIAPINPLKPNTTYTVTVPSNFAKSRLNPGMPMKKDYAFSFTTGSNSPAISSIYPADNAKNVPIDTKIEIEYLSEVKSGPRLSDVQVSDSTGNRILARALINGKKVSITLLNYWLNPDETYTFLVPAGAVTDLAGNSNDSLNFSFSTGKQINLAENASFTVNPSTRWLVNKELVFSAEKLFSTFRIQKRIIESYEWYFGDYTSASGKSATHTYRSEGDYTVTLKIKDNAGLSYEISRSVNISDFVDASQVEMTVSPEENQNLTHTDVYSDRLDVIPGRRLFTIDVLYMGAYMPNEKVNVALYKGNKLIKNYGEVITKADAKDGTARAYFAFDYTSISLFGTYELVFTWENPITYGTETGIGSSVKQVRRTVVISDKRTKQHLRFKLYNMDTGDLFGLYPFIPIELDGQRTDAMKIALSEDDGGGICYEIKDVSLGLHTLKIIREGFIEHNGETELMHTGMHDISILKAERDKLGIKRVWSKYSDSNNDSDSTFIYTFIADSSMTTRFCIDTNWRDTEEGFYQVKIGDWEQRFYESSFDLSPLDIYPGQRLLVRAVSRFGNVSPWVDAKIATVDPPESTGIEYSYVNGELVAEAFMSPGSHSAGEIDEISKMPFLEHSSILGMSSSLDMFRSSFRQTPENMELLFQLDASGSYGEKEKKKKMVTVGWGVDVDVDGSFLLIYNKLTGNWHFNTGEVNMTGNLYVYRTKGYTVPVIDAGATITLTLGSEIGNTLYIDKRPEAKHEYSGIIRIEPYATVDVYGGIEGFNIEGQVDGRIKTQLHIPTGYIQVDPSLSGWIKATVLGIRKTVFDETATTSWNNGKEKVTAPTYSMNVFSAIGAGDQMELIPRNYLANVSNWLAGSANNIGTSKVLSQNGVIVTGDLTRKNILNALQTEPGQSYIQTMKSNVYPYADVQLVRNGSELWMLWIDDNPERSAANRTQLHYSVQRGGTWTQPQRLNNDGTADFAPVAAAAGDGVLAAWQNIKNILKDEASIDRIAENSEIFVSNGIYSGIGELDVVRLSNDELYDHSPSIAASSGNNGLLVWVKSEGLNLTGGGEGSNKLVYSQWNGSRWSEATTLQDKLPMVVDSSLFCGNNQYLLLYSVDEDNNSATTNDWELYARTYDIATRSWSEAVRLTDNNVPDSYAKAVCSKGDWFITWSSGEQFMYQIGLSGEAKTEDTLAGISGNYQLAASNVGASLSETASLSGEASQNGDEKLIALVYPKTEESSGRSFVAHYFDPNNKVWGSEVSLTGDEGFIRSFSPVFTGDGRINIAFSSAKVITEVVNEREYKNPSDTVDIKMLQTYTGKRDLAISEDGIQLSVEIPFPGTAVTVFGTISNLGDYAEKAKLIVYDGAQENGVKIGEAITENPIPAHAEATLEIEWAVDSDIKAVHELHAVVVPIDEIDELDMKNNTARLEVKTSDVAVDDVKWSGLVGSDYLVSPQLCNRGTKVLKDIQVILEHNGKTIASGIIEEINPGEFADFDFLVSTKELTADINGKFALSVKAAISSGDAEYSYENNVYNFEIYTVPIAVTSMNIANGDKNVNVKEVISLTFNRSIAEGQSFGDIVLTDDALNRVEIRTVIEGKTLTVIPKKVLENDRSYRLTLPEKAVEDSHGYALQTPYTIRFETVSLSPKVVFEEPWDESEGVDCNTDIRIKYSGKVGIGPAFGGIYIAALDPVNKADQVNQVKIPATVTLEGEWVTIRPSVDLSKNTLYIVVIPKGSVKSSSGHNQAEDYELVFTTGTEAGYAKPNGQDPLMSFKDITSDWAIQPIEIMASRKLINGRGNRIFDPLGKISRAEFTAMIVRTLDVAPANFKGTFKDVEENAWYAANIETAASLGLIEGMGSSRFAPNDNISRQQLAVIAYRLYKYKNQGLNKEVQDKLNQYSFLDTKEIADYAKGAVNFLAGKGIMTGDGVRFKPNATASRQEAAVVLYRLLELLGEI
ncbi:MAG: Ig-like domain-containing protein [Eubacteriales bacterium]|nr:Ig-like domain-containing protein [Eubacteriales bacterium]